MRKLASYSLEAATRDAATATQLAQQINVCIDGWVTAKGTISEDGRTLRMDNGRTADLERSTVQTTRGRLAELVLSEPNTNGWFRTSLCVATDASRAVVCCELSAGTQSLMPLWVDVRGPRIIRDILAIPAGWSYGASPASEIARQFRDAVGGDAFTELVWDASRTLPVVAIAEEYGLLLNPGITESMAADLAGLAIVAQLSDAASWRVTQRKGKPWSCYGGAIRIYWPGISVNSDPADHPLWTARRLLFGLADTYSAAGRIRSQIRKRILGQSAFAIREHELVGAIRKSVRDEQISTLRARITESDDHRALSDEYLTKILELNDALSAKDEEISGLKDQVSSLQLALRWRDSSPDAVAPVEESPPSTVEDAVLTAMDKFEDALVFGADVNDGIRALAADAGPPDKLLDYLEALADMTAIRKTGSLGNTPIGWLEAKGFSVSGESETIRNSPTEMRKRRWDNGSGERLQFETHMKPSEATAPDRCVRIYFDWDDNAKKTIVGWVGRHP